MEAVEALSNQLEKITKKYLIVKTAICTVIAENNVYLIKNTNYNKLITITKWKTQTQKY